MEIYGIFVISEYLWVWLVYGSARRQYAIWCTLAGKGPCFLSWRSKIWSTLKGQKRKKRDSAMFN